MENSLFRLRFGICCLRQTARLLPRIGLFIVKGRPNTARAPDAAIKYLANYVTGTAISDKRILADDGRYVTFSAKDYRHDSRRITLRVTGEEFVRRFRLAHLAAPYVSGSLLWVLHEPESKRRPKTVPGTVGRRRRARGDVVRQVGRGRWDGDADDEAKADDSAPAACPECGSRDMVWQYDVLPQAMWRVQLHLHTFPNAARREESVIHRPFARPP